MKRLIEITIVSLFLFGVAFCFGCKDKAEAEITWLIEPNDITITLPDPNAAIEFIDMDEPLMVITPENKYPLTATITGEDGIDREVTFEIINDEIVCSTTAKEAVEILYLCLCTNFGQKDDYGKGLMFRFEEPNEPELIIDETWVTDPNYSLIVSDPNSVITITDDFASDTLYINDTEIHLKNMPLLTKDEIRDFAIVIGAATARLYACDEFYEGLIRLVPEKLLQEPEEDKCKNQN